ncbi:hypothetical protein BGY98DRAFT_1000767 [Russula aff. rugulosa BPL654]|nr:hypothetical protein BGY98DRAFT_1000767 [Russula aff. rugulosa BPL654]
MSRPIPFLVDTSHPRFLMSDKLFPFYHTSLSLARSVTIYRCLFIPCGDHLVNMRPQTPSLPFARPRAPTAESSATSKIILRSDTRNAVSSSGYTSMISPSRMLSLSLGSFHLLFSNVSLLSLFHPNSPACSYRVTAHQRQNIVIDITIST